MLGREKSRGGRRLLRSEWRGDIKMKTSKIGKKNE